jgi:23S rRNA pseudouridine1911/1915/1917 synthase
MEKHERSEGPEHEVPADLGGRPLDGVVRALFGATWGKARSWIASGKVSVDGRTVTEVEKRVRAGARVVLAMNAPRRAAGPRLEDEAVAHVDAHVVVVNKPAGISTIPYDESEKGTLDELVRTWLSRRGAPRGDRGARPNLGVVHRLDKETSGLLVFTRTWLAKKSLAQQFREHTVHRRYLAIVHGYLTRGRTIESMLVENRGDGLRGSLKRGAKNPDAQRAVTHIAPLEPLQNATLIECRLETGRTHQIRIHLSEAGHPLVGERVYVRGFAGEPIPAPRMMLHAAELGFVHPATELEVRWERPPPADFDEVLARLRGK